MRPHDFKGPLAAAPSHTCALGWRSCCSPGHRVLPLALTTSPLHCMLDNVELLRCQPVRRVLCDVLLKREDHWVLAVEGSNELDGAAVAA